MCQECIKLARIQHDDDILQSLIDEMIADDISRGRIVTEAEIQWLQRMVFTQIHKEN